MNTYILFLVNIFMDNSICSTNPQNILIELNFGKLILGGIEENLFNISNEISEYKYKYSTYFDHFAEHSNSNIIPSTEYNNDLIKIIQEEINKSTNDSATSALQLNKFDLYTMKEATSPENMELRANFTKNIQEVMYKHNKLAE